MCTYTNAASYVTVNRKQRKISVSQFSRRFVIDVFVDCLGQKVEEWGYSISSRSVSTGYAALMLTEGAWVDLSSTHKLWAPSVNISAEYPALPDHDSMNNPSKFLFLLIVLRLIANILCSYVGSKTVTVLNWGEIKKLHLGILLWLLGNYQLMVKNSSISSVILGGNNCFLFVEEIT